MPDVATVDSSAERAQDVRDLRDEMVGLTAQDSVKSIAPSRKMATVYSTIDGEELQWPLNAVARLLEKKREDGKYMFTARKSEAPEYRLGEVKCFLHPESPERPILEQIGLARVTCPAAHLANIFSRDIHAQNRHGKQWQAYQRHIAEQKQREVEERQQQQLEATLALARAASGNAETKRSGMSDEQRQALSDRMKARHAAKREEAAHETD